MTLDDDIFAGRARQWWDGPAPYDKPVARCPDFASADARIAAGTATRTEGPTDHGHQPISATVDVHYCGGKDDGDSQSSSDIDADDDVDPPPGTAAEGMSSNRK